MGGDKINSFTDKMPGSEGGMWKVKGEKKQARFRNKTLLLHFRLSFSSSVQTVTKVKWVVKGSRTMT